MENCYLDKDEVVLFRDEVTLLQNVKNSKTRTELLLTNKRLIFINKTKNRQPQGCLFFLLLSVYSEQSYA